MPYVCHLPEPTQRATTIGNPMRIVRYMETGAAALAIVLLIVGGSFWLLTTPGCVRVLVLLVDSAEETGLGEQATLDIAEDVRRFVVDPDAPPLPAAIDGMPAFDTAAVAHLVDVCKVMVPVRWLTLGLFAAVVGWVLLRWRTIAGRQAMAAASGVASAVMLGGGALALVIGVVDFNAFFTWFHSLFFAKGTWVFPYEALLIRVFPPPFWIAAGAAWGILVLIAAAVLCWLARRMRFTVGTYGV